MVYKVLQGSPICPVDGYTSPLVQSEFSCGRLILRGNAENPVKDQMQRGLQLFDMYPRVPSHSTRAPLVSSKSGGGMHIARVPESCRSRT